MDASKYIVVHGIGEVRDDGEVVESRKLVGSKEVGSDGSWRNIEPMAVENDPVVPVACSAIDLSVGGYKSKYNHTQYDTAYHQS